LYFNYDRSIGNKKAVAMYHLKCVGCRIRVRAYQRPGDVDEPCPVCGAPLESVAHLSELMGLQEYSEISRWVDDGGSVSAEAVAKALAPPTPR